MADEKLDREKFPMRASVEAVIEKYRTEHSKNPDLLRMSGMSMKMLIAEAYHIRRSDVPKWIKKHPGEITYNNIPIQVSPSAGNNIIALERVSPGK